VGFAIFYPEKILGPAPDCLSCSHGQAAAHLQTLDNPRKLPLLPSPVGNGAASPEHPSSLGTASSRLSAAAVLPDGAHGCRGRTSPGWVLCCVFMPVTAPCEACRVTSVCS